MPDVALPTFFILGPPKTGTTALHYYLSQHPDILMSEPINWGISGLSFVYGAEYADASESEMATYNRTTGAIVGTSTSASQFTGFGPEAGLRLAYKPFAGVDPFLGGFGVEAGVTGSLLLASASSSLVDVYNGIGIGSVWTESTGRIIPALHVRAALTYSHFWDRFGFTAHMDFYEPAELERVLARSAGILGIELGAEAGAEIARRSRGTPRIANRLLRRVRDYAEVRADGVITRDIAKYALEVGFSVKKT